MMPMIFRMIITCLILCLSITTALAQYECPVMEEAAFAETALWCSDLESNHLCYGNADLSLTPIESVPVDVAFNAPGDSIPNYLMSKLESHTGDTVYGVAMADSKAYPLENWIPESASLMVIGDVTLQNMGTEAVEIPTLRIEVTISSGANIRSGPSTDYRVITPVSEGDILKATGRLGDNSWLQVALPDGQTGWVSAVVANADFSELPIVEAADTAPQGIYLPLQALQLTTGQNDARCDEAPDSGLIIQTQGDAFLKFMVNGVQIHLKGTVFLQSSIDTGLQINLIEGAAFVITDDVEQALTGGYQTRIPLEESEDFLHPAGELLRPELYDYSRMVQLPVRWLPRDIYVQIDLRTIIKPPPENGLSPIATMLATDPCRFTIGPGGANLRTGPGTEYPIRGVMAQRESAAPDGRAFGSDGFPWWRLAEGIWIRQDTTVTGGDCVAVPEVPVPPAPRARD